MRTSHFLGSVPSLRDCSLFMPKGGPVFRVGGGGKIFKINKKGGVFF